jgi:hypothetical protein
MGKLLIIYQKGESVGWVERSETQPSFHILLINRQRVA